MGEAGTKRQSLALGVCSGSPQSGWRLLAGGESWTLGSPGRPLPEDTETQDPKQGVERCLPPKGGDCQDVCGSAGAWGRAQAPQHPRRSLSQEGSGKWCVDLGGGFALVFP